MKKLFYLPLKENGPDSNMLFWGCWHGGHDPKWEIPLWEMRGFPNVDTHDATLMTRWNSKATPNTIGFLLGDNMFGQNAQQRLIDMLDEMKFKRLYMMPGNHQAGWKAVFESCEANVYRTKNGGEVIFTPNYIEAIINGQPIVMSHYPVLSWNGQGKQSYMLFSHVHGSLNKSEIGRMYLEKGLNKEVSVEICPFPITFGELRAEMRQKEWASPDHHDKNTQNPF